MVGENNDGINRTGSFLHDPSTGRLIVPEKLITGVGGTPYGDDGGVVEKAIDHTWEGDGTNNRLIDLADDYDFILIWSEESFTSGNTHAGQGLAFKNYYEMRINTGGTLKHNSLGGADLYFQGKQTGGDINKIKLGTSGIQDPGLNLAGTTYRLLGFKFSSME